MHTLSGDRERPQTNLGQNHHLLCKTTKFIANSKLISLVNVLAYIYSFSPFFLNSLFNLFLLEYVDENGPKLSLIMVKFNALLYLH